MKTWSLAVALLLATTGYVGPAAADPWKDESGHGRWVERVHDYDRGWRGRRAYRERYYYGDRRYRYDRHAYRQRYRDRCRVELIWYGNVYVEQVRCRSPSGYYYRY